MCYRVYTHKLVCDARPVLSDGSNLLIDPYAPPVPCHCRATYRDSRPPSASTHLRCRHHDCCSLSARTYICPAQCHTPRIYQVYVQRDDRSRKHVHFRPHAHAHAHRWRDLPIFDGSVFPILSRSTSPSSSRYSSRRSGGEPLSAFCQAESAEFKLARDQMLQTGRVLDHILLEMDKAEFNVKRLRHRHHRAHGSACERDFRAPGLRCVYRERILNLEDHADDLDFAAGGFERLWQQWKLHVRALEKQGDRRLGGLEEWRRRQGRSSDREGFEELMRAYK